MTGLFEAALALFLGKLYVRLIERRYRGHGLGALSCILFFCMSGLLKFGRMHGLI